MSEATPETYDKGLVWNDQDKFIDQKWPEYSQKVRKTHGGIGIAAADFNELLRYGHGLNPWGRRNYFTQLVKEATSDEDLDLLAKILAVMMIEPRVTSLDGGWFIHRLRTSGDQFDARRAALILNRLYEIHSFAATVLIFTLGGFVNTYEDEILLLDEILATGLLSEEVRRLMERPSAFLSYAREDSGRVEMLYQALLKKISVFGKTLTSYCRARNGKVRLDVHSEIMSSS